MISKMMAARGLVRPAFRTALVRQTPMLNFRVRDFCDSMDSKLEEILKKEKRPLILPTAEDVMNMPRHHCEYSNETLIAMVASGDHDAQRERVIREVMHVDGVSWEEGRLKMLEIEKANLAGTYIFTIPYKVGIVFGSAGAFLSIPLVFHLDTALWFNEHFVTAEVASPEDLETVLECGSWTWSWMEPPLGQVSFFLLSLQFARNQMQNIGAKPYTEWLKTYRANKLIDKYPQYNAAIIEGFSKGSGLTRLD